MGSIFYDVTDVQAVLECSKSKAYKIIKQLNDELQAEGKIIHMGRVPIDYFNERHEIKRTLNTP